VVVFIGFAYAHRRQASGGADEVAVSVFDRCDQIATTNIIDLLVLFAIRGEDCSGS
jgi:hypothetical protein